MILTEMKNFSFLDINGKTVSINDFKGKNTLVFMWASW
jgi:peroxiredoxin